MKKRFISMALVLCLLLSVLPFAAQATPTLRDDYSAQKNNIAQEADKNRWTDQELKRDFELPDSGISTADLGDTVLDEKEPNENESNCQTIYHDYTVRGTISGDDVDGFKFDVTTESEIVIACFATVGDCLYGIIDLENDHEAMAATNSFEYDAENDLYRADLNVTLEPGSYAVIIGSESGEVDLTYVFYFMMTEPNETLYRISGNDRVETALEVANYVMGTREVESFDYIIMANGDNFADALTGSYLACVKGAPILLYRSSGVEKNQEYILQNLSSGGTVYILGGTSAVPVSVENSLKNSGVKVKRLAGSSRFDTNLAILEEAGVRNEEILIATGWNFADSLSASATGLPILMVNTVSGELTEAQVEFLKDHASNTFTVIGGTGAVSAELEIEIQDIVGQDIGRIFGDTREATSVAIAERYFSNPWSVIMAYSRNFPDGLCGGPLAYVAGIPLLLICDTQIAPAKEYVATYEFRKGYILGGESAVSWDTAKRVFGWIQ